MKNIKKSNNESDEKYKFSNIRMTEHVIIDSHELRNVSDDPSNAFYTFGTNLDGEYDLRCLLLTNTFYNVDSTNNKIYFNENSSNKTATITPGYYTVSTITTAVKSALDTASGGYNTFTVSIDSATKKMTFSASNNFSFVFTSELTPYNTAHDILGIGYRNTTAATSYTATNIVNLGDPMSVYINIDAADNQFMSASNDVFGCIFVPLVKVYGEVIEINQLNYPQTIKIKHTNRLRIQIRDADGQIRGLNGGRFQMWLSKKYEY